MKNILILPLLLLSSTLLTPLCRSMLTASAMPPQSSLDPRLSRSLSTLRNRADTGDPDAMFRLSQIYEQGYHHILPDSAKADSLLTASARLNYPPALNYLGFKLFPTNPDSAVKLIEKAALAGDIKAANNLGYLLAYSDHVTRDYDKAIHWLHRAADAGLPVAMTQLADLYREGKASAPDTATAALYYDKALSLRFRDAEPKLLSMMKSRYLALTPDSALSIGLGYYNTDACKIAVTLFNIAAQAGNPHALALLGDAYSKGRGVPYNHQKSLRYFLLAAQAGNPSAQFILAELLEIFPDALSSLDPPHSSLTLNPQTLRSQAAREGITDASTAAARLLEP